MPELAVEPGGGLWTWGGGHGRGAWEQQAMGRFPPLRSPLLIHMFVTEVGPCVALLWGSCMGSPGSPAPKTSWLLLFVHGRCRLLVRAGSSPHVSGTEEARKEPAASSLCGPKTFP